MDKRGFSGASGFVFSAIGAAVGLGNIWSFPRYFYSGNGLLFLIIYIALAVLVGAPMLACEFAIGRDTAKKPRAAMRELCGSARAGIIAETACFIMLGFYCVIGGCFLRYTQTSLVSVFSASSTGAQATFLAYISDVPLSVSYTLIFLAVATAIILCGVGRGLEKFARFSVSLMLLMLPLLALCAISLSGTGAFLQMLKLPESLTLAEFCEVFACACMQMFFSLSLGMGAMLCFGAYLPTGLSIPKCVAVIITADTAVALLAAVVVCVSAEGTSGGAMLIFVAMQSVFDAYGAWGAFFGFLFYLLVALAALTSAVAMLEVVSDCVGYIGSRNTAIILASIATSIPAVAIARDALGFGELATIFGLNYLELAEVVSEAVLMPLSALLFALALRSGDARLRLSRQLGDRAAVLCDKSLRYLAVPMIVLAVVARWISEK